MLLTTGFALTLWKVINGSWGSDITVIAPVVSMLGLTLLPLEPMNKIGSFFYVGMAGMANQRLVRAFLSGKSSSHGQDADANPDNAQVVPHSDSFLSLQGLSFAYPGGDPVLQNLDLEIKNREWVAIAGASGAGKSTLIEVLKGNLLPSQGAYYLQGRSLDANSSTWFSDQSALVQQHTWIFTGTIRSNLMMVAPRASEDRLWECLEKVRLAAEVRAFAQGLDTPVGEDDYTWQIGSLTFNGIALGSAAAIVVYHVMRGISKARGTFLEQASPASVPAGTDLESRSYEKRVAHLAETLNPKADQD